MNRVPLLFVLLAVAGRGGRTDDDAGHGELVSFEEPFWFAVVAFRPGVRLVR